MALTLTYLGCEGVLVRSDAGSILIDGLYGEEAAPFGVPPEPVLEKLRDARPPFDRVDVILATHFHGDHFDPVAVARHLRANPNSHFVSTTQATVQVMEATHGLLGHRVHGITAAEGVVVRRDVGHVHIQAFGLSHGKVHYADVQHLGFVVTLGERSIIHLGDGIINEKSLRAAGVIDRAIDVGVLPFWFLTYPFGRRLVSNGFRPQALFAVHVRANEREKVTGEIASWIDATPLIVPMERYEIAAGGGVTKKEPLK
ncbi:MAG TPA: MBL fold metallo-hydrolase [Candidatus Krumholzibacteria bacterium]|nr:MBL fold metallo-hydrolase [Candidatus Krumholzibacteria bacterium]